ncbi:hypothetical protein chiPu_0031998, partial [Chiloscyllium punctatum]|nr:hypothetical protein [Chiloscyllium punctatum]
MQAPLQAPPRPQARARRLRSRPDILKPSIDIAPAARSERSPARAAHSRDYRHDHCPRSHRADAGRPTRRAASSRTAAHQTLAARLRDRSPRPEARRAADGERARGRRSRRDGRHPQAIGQGQRERRQAQRGQPRFHAIDGEEHSPARCRRGHAGGADGLGACDGDALCPAPRACRRPR